MPLRILTCALALALACPVAAQDRGLAGPYLAARTALMSSDYQDAARYYRRALSAQPSRLSLMESAFIAYIGVGDLDAAAALAERHELAGGRNQVADLLLDSHAIKKGDFSRASQPVIEQDGLAPLVSGLVRAWALLGQGKMSEAIEGFEDVAKIEDFASFAHYHRAIALASVGDFESSNAILSGETYGPLVLSPRGLQAHAQVLVQLDRRDDAVELLTAAVANRFNPELEALKNRIEEGEAVEYDFVTNGTEGTAEVFFNTASVLNGRAAPENVLLYARAAQYLRPDHVPAILMIAEVLDDQSQFDLAAKAFASVPADHGAYVLAELGRANALYASDRQEAAVEVLTALSRTHPKVSVVHATRGDMLGRMEQNEEALEAYDQAIQLREGQALGLWRLYYARGIIHERELDFASMEADFRMALQLEPDQPDVLNYLGYSLVEQRIKLDEALEMIKTAVEKKPQSGYITDSLAWIYYRLGRFEEAVSPMEKAVELLPVDPIVNDHLGDVYWMVGRKREAEFQWKRALSFEPVEKEAERIRAKLAEGLDVVLAREQTDEETQTAQD